MNFANEYMTNHSFRIGMRSGRLAFHIRRTA